MIKKIKSKPRLILFFILFLFLGFNFLYISAKIQKSITPDNRSYEQIIQEDSPREALRKLQMDIDLKPEVAKNCHPIAHKLGQISFEKYKDFSEAANFQDSVCNSGYIHGVIESALVGSKDITADMRKLCNQNFKSHFEEWQCFHGVGHGVMFFTNNNLPLSLQYCKSLEDFVGQGNCANGVFMENFRTDSQYHKTDFVKEANLFYPCNEVQDEFKGECYYYAPVYILSKNHNDYMQTYRECLTLDENFQLMCIRGIAGEAVKQNYDDVTRVENICMEFDPVHQKACIRSMVSMIVNMNGRVDKKFCEQLDHRTYCYEELERKVEELSSE